MKVKNIMFSGFAAAILMGTVNAHAAFEIASKKYVDNLVGENGSITQDVSEIQSTIAGANETLTGVDATTLTGAINELASELGDETTARENADTAINNKIGSGFDSTNTVAAALDTKVDKTSVATSISANPVNTKWASEKAVADAIAAAVSDVTGDSGSVSEQIGNALGDLGTHAGANPGDDPVPNTVKDVTDALDNRLDTAESEIDTLQDTVGNGQLANGFTNGVNDLTEAVNDLQSTKANTSDVYTKTQMDTLLGAKLDKPVDNTCTAASQHCVLHMMMVNNEPVLSWIDVTNPAE